ncbi:MAG: thiamine diphosphokinase [Euryarchaeota archaeon]|nr:thiamine diphosphokinase [Euryarchaeota archaeon]|tara:strand:+ start:36 stop:674 length:639 start_codon:yes stop_codon:yes gene_type:complete
MLGDSMLRVLIIGNAPGEDLSQWSNLVLDSDLIIACDGAMEKCQSNGIVVNVLIGDMDSISEPSQRYAESKRVKIIKQTDQNTNDLTKAISYADSVGATKISIINVDGGRSDHQFANYLSLLEAKSDARLLLNDCTVRALSNNKPISHSIEIGTEFSVFSLGQSSGINLAGGKWVLKNAVLESNSTGLHNVAVEDVISIDCKTGNLLMFVSH